MSLKKTLADVQKLSEHSAVESGASSPAASSSGKDVAESFTNTPTVYE